MNPVGFGASREDPFAQAGVLPKLSHDAHGIGVACGWCDAPPESKPKQGHFPEAKREARP